MKMFTNCSIVSKKEIYSQKNTPWWQFVLCGENSDCRCVVSIRDILSWVNFINTCSIKINVDTTETQPGYNQLEPAVALIHGVCLVFLDSLGAGNSYWTEPLNMHSLYQWLMIDIDYCKEWSWHYLNHHLTPCLTTCKCKNVMPLPNTHSKFIFFLFVNRYNIHAENLLDVMFVY